MQAVPIGRIANPTIERSAVGAIVLWMQLLHNKKSQVLIADNSACVSDPPQNLALGLDGAREIL